LELALDIRFFEDVERGLGPIRIAGFKTPGGRHFAIIEYLKSPIGRGVQIEALHDEHFATDLDEILEALDMDLSDVAEFNSKTSISPEVRSNSHVLWRGDDNGARTVIGTFPCRASATKQMRAFEAAGHKQTYWVDPQTP
jgi:hypothetical protein